MNTKYYNAIVFFPENLKIRPRKYHNIKNLENFSNFCQKKGAEYINLYDKKTKKYSHRIYITI